ncbi:MAG TPA: family 16 glycoside hydrolase, partial [Polyangia bacterium]
RQGKWRFEPTGELVAEGGGHSAYVLLTGARPRDLDLTVEVMFLTNESSAGLVLRASGARAFRDDTFYQYEWYTRGSHHDKRLSLMVKNPRWVQIVTPVYPDAPLRRWIRLRVRAQGDLLECFADGKLVFTKRDRRFLRDGRVGLHVFMPRAVRFRGFQLVDLAAKAP